MHLLIQKFSVPKIGANIAENGAEEHRKSDTLQQAPGAASDLRPSAASSPSPRLGLPASRPRHKLKYAAASSSWALKMEFSQSESKE